MIGTVPYLRRVGCPPWCGRTTPSSKRSRTRSSTAMSPYQRGTAQAALRHRNFRIVYLGTFASNIGTWMQNVMLGAFASEAHRAHRAFVGLIFFAQLGPLLFLSTTGGLLADIVDRRRLLVTAQVVMMAFSFASGRAGAHGRSAEGRDRRARVRDRHRQLARRARPRARSCRRSCRARTWPARSRSQSVQMNLSRVIGPAIGGVLYATFDAAPVFAINALDVRLRDHRAAVGDVSAPRRTRRSKSAACAGCFPG